MKIVGVLCLAAIEIFGYGGAGSKFDDGHVNIRHARKKDLAGREDHAFRANGENEYNSAPLAWSTESSADYESMSERSDEKTTVTDEALPVEGDANDAAARHMKEDVVTKFLNILDGQQEDNCTAGTGLNLGEGVVDRYAQDRFRVEAEVAVNRANMLTRLWKYVDRESMLHAEYLFYASVLSMVEFNETIFAAGNCYDKNQYAPYVLFCPYAYRLPEGKVLVKNLAVEYKYLGNGSEWFFAARKNAAKVITKKRTFKYGYHTYTFNDTAHTERESDEVLSVSYEDGRWSKPYYDCGGGNIWMLTYTVPFFGYDNVTGTYFFKGTSGIDIDLRRVDIDQCPVPRGEQTNIFAASDKCKKGTTSCVSIKGLGFRRGSYKCVCRRGFYFPNGTANVDYFDGAVIEEEYEKLTMGGTSSIYNESTAFQCLPCAEGCETCVNSSPCIVTLNWPLRSVILGISCLIILILVVVEFFTWKYRNVQVIRAASPVLLKVIALGAFFIYSTTIVMYPVPTVVTCTVKLWLREIGFSLTYGALMLKTWRISVIFHVRSARAVKITDMDLLAKLGVIVLVFTAFLCVRTLVAPPLVNTVRTADNLKAYLCETNLWDHWFSTMEALLLLWGIRLCAVVRKAPSEFNESRFISMAIYNEFVVSIFLNVFMFFLYSPAKPDLLYVIYFGYTQMTVTSLLCFIFGSRAYMIIRGHGGGSNISTMKTKNVHMYNTKFLPKKRALSSTSQAFPSTSSINISGNTDVKLQTERDIREEINNICKQVEQLKEKNMRLGSKKLAVKLNAMYDCSVRTLDEVSIDEDFSSIPSQERTTDDGKVTSDKTSGSATKNWSNAKCATSAKRENCCSTENADGNEPRVTNKTASGASRLRKYIFGSTKLFSRNDHRPEAKRGGDEVPMEPIRAHHAIIFTVEENSADTQVSL